MTALLEQNRIPYSLTVIPCGEGEQIKPNEFAVGSVALNLDHRCDILIAVGSGVINDTCRVVSKVAQRPYIIVGTAPSMDGYASGSSSMEVNKIKQSLPEQLPGAIICDASIMARAPERLLWAGFGDMLAKYSALCEWRIAELVNDEYYCENIARQVRDSLNQVVDQAEGIKRRDEGAICSMAEGLVLSGIGMAFAGSSRPASGLEHYFSHCWEMMALARGEESDLHGIQVGVGTLLTLRLYEHMKTIRPTFERVEAAVAAFDQESWEKRIRSLFADAADEILTMAARVEKNDGEKRKERAKKIINHWDDIVRIMEETLPDYHAVEEKMHSLGMPTRAEQIGLRREDVINAFVCSRDVRDKYLLSSLLWDIGYLDEFARWLEAQI